MPGIRHHGQPGTRPGRHQVEGGLGRADHVVAPLHHLGRDMRYAAHMGQQPVLRQEQVVREVVRLDPRQAQRSAVLREACHRVRARQQGAATAFVLAPGPRRRQVHQRVGVAEPPQVGPQDVAPLLRRQVLDEGCPGIGEDAAKAGQEPLHLRPAAEEDAAQHAARHPLRMRLGIGEREGRAPGPAKQQPALDAERSPQRLDIRH